MVVVIRKAFPSIVRDFLLYSKGVPSIARDEGISLYSKIISSMVREGFPSIVRGFLI